MKCIPSFFTGAVIGVAIGAVLALLFAPTSGEELRARVGQGAATERQKVQASYEKARHQVQERVDKLQHHQQTGSTPSTVPDEGTVA